MTHRITDADAPYRSPNKVSDTPQRFNRTTIVIGAILLFVLVSITAVASAMFFRISATPETDHTVSLKEFIEDPNWRGDKPSPEPEPDWEEQME